MITIKDFEVLEDLSIINMVGGKVLLVQHENTDISFLSSGV
ncbi:MAG: hypothetical protein ACJA0U_000089 [Salibacteraceae bacterium]|jgi:hypothetical protein